MSDDRVTAIDADFSRPSPAAERLREALAEDKNESETPSSEMRPEREERAQTPPGRLVTDPGGIVV